MKRLLICFCLFSVTLLISACGKTEFTATSPEAIANSAESASLGDDQIPAEEVLDNDGDDEELAEIHECKPGKVYVCHVPSGNPAARHTICISRAALAAHIDRHGVEGDYDTLGKCAADKRHGRCNDDEGDDEAAAD